MAERVQQVKGPGARPPRGVKPQVKNPMKIFTRIMKYALKDYTVHCIAVVIAIFVNVLANVQGTMFMKTLIDGYITPMLTQRIRILARCSTQFCGWPDFTGSVLWLRSFRTVP